MPRTGRVSIVQDIHVITLLYELPLRGNKAYKLLNAELLSGLYQGTFNRRLLLIKIDEGA